MMGIGVYASDLDSQADTLPYTEILAEKSMLADVNEELSDDHCIAVPYRFYYTDVKVSYLDETFYYKHEYPFRLIKPPLFS